jgi:hypothetical protein
MESEFTATHIGYDGVNRVSSITHDLGGASHDIAWGFTYNPSSHIAALTTSNTIYDYKETVSSTDNRTFNGLNQDAGIAALGGGFGSFHRHRNVPSCDDGEILARLLKKSQQASHRCPLRNEKSQTVSKRVPFS